MEKLNKEINQAQYLSEICKESPFIVLRTECGEVQYRFNEITFKNDELLLSFKLMKNSKYKATALIQNLVGDDCYLKPEEFLCLFDHTACA